MPFNQMELSSQMLRYDTSCPIEIFQNCPFQKAEVTVLLPEKLLDVKTD
uniref:Uncharacterized protein n=1 Tax=Arundo donax TaxID=35708 RepID=A0A0A9F774_ARUDO